MSDNTIKTLACGCLVETQRDFLGRVVGTIVSRGAECPHDAHVLQHVLVMPGRENARAE